MCINQQRQRQDIVTQERERQEHSYDVMNLDMFQDTFLFNFAFILVKLESILY